MILVPGDFGLCGTNVSSSRLVSVVWPLPGPATAGLAGGVENLGFADRRRVLAEELVSTTGRAGRRSPSAADGPLKLDRQCPEGRVALGRQITETTPGAGNQVMRRERHSTVGGPAMKARRRCWATMTRCGERSPGQLGWASWAALPAAQDFFVPLLNAAVAPKALIQRSGTEDQAMSEEFGHTDTILWYVGRPRWSEHLPARASTRHEDLRRDEAAVLPPWCASTATWAGPGRWR